jgi:hypothetical protein
LGDFFPGGEGTLIQGGEVAESTTTIIIRGTRVHVHGKKKNPEICRLRVLVLIKNSDGIG